MLDRAFWNGRRVFLTGHTGFKGSWLSLWLEKLGASVTGYALDPPTTPNLFEQAQVSSSVESVHGDVRDLPRLKSSLAECRPDVVIHMAAQSVVRRGYSDPIETYSSNVMGTVNLFEALRQIGRPTVVVNVTSDKCYANDDRLLGYREDDALGGHDPYSNSKACAELITSAYRESYFRPHAGELPIAVASARAGNVIGGGDWTADQLVPDLMRAFLSSTSGVIRHPHAIRPWQFVLEPLRGYLMLAEKLARQPELFTSAWNFGPVPEDARPVSWIADELVRLWGESAAWRTDGDGAHPKEANRLTLDASKAASSLDWTPALPLECALPWVVEWYRSFQRGCDLRRLSYDQIERYEARLTS